MSLLFNHPAFLKILRIVLRIIAWISSLSLIVVLLAALLVTNLNVLTPPLVKYASARLGGQIDYGYVGVGWVDRFVVFRLGDLQVQQKTQQEQLDFSVDQIEVRIAQPSTEQAAWEVAAIDIHKPKTVYRRVIQAKKDESKASTEPITTSAIPASVRLLSYVQQINVVDGEYEIQIQDGERLLDFAGAFRVEGRSEDKLNNLSIKLSAAEDIYSKLELNAASSRQPNGTNLTVVELLADSVDVAHLVSIVSDHPRVASMNLANLEALTDVRAYANWTDESLESIRFNVVTSDPNLDGQIPESKFATLKAQGQLDLGTRANNSIEVEFELNSLDLAAAMTQVPGAFPPKFYEHASQRLRSLWLTGLKGNFSGDPNTLFRPQGDWNLTAEGNFSNYTYLFGDKWPPLENASGTYQFNGKSLTITSNGGSVYGQPIAYAVAQIDDVSIADPIMNLNVKLGVPVDIAMDLFGAKGIVSPGKLDWVETGSGAGAIDMRVDVPLRRGKEFSVAGDIQLKDVELTSTHGVRADQIIGQMQFNRYGITLGELEGQVFSGPFSTRFTGTGNKENFTFEGEASGQALASALDIVLGKAVTAKLLGEFDWDSSYRFSPKQNEVHLSTSFADVVSTLPHPMRKGAGVGMPLNVIIQTTDQTTRNINLDLGEVAQASLIAQLKDNKWQVRSGSLIIGEPLPVEADDSGIVVSVKLPVLEYGAWSNLLKDNEGSGDYEFASAFKTIAIKTDELVLFRQRKFSNAQIMSTKTATHWDIDLSADTIRGNVRYVSPEFIQEGETPSLAVDLSRCHIPAAEGQPGGQPLNPVNLPILNVRCEDTRYGQYFLGQSIIDAEPGIDSWQITRAQFNTPSSTLQAKGDWFHNQSSKLNFNLNSVDFGQTMNNFGFPERFKRGKTKINGTLQWDAALTQWETHLTSGKVEVQSTDGTIISKSSPDALKVVGALNYDTIFKRFSNDIVDVVGEDGILYDKLTGSAELRNGIFEVDGVFVEGPSASMVVTGKTDWNSKEHSLMLGVEPQIRNSLTTLATLLINPISGALVYAGSKLADQIKLNFTYRYNLSGPWDNPVIKYVESNGNGIGSTNQSGSGQ